MLVKDDTYITVQSFMVTKLHLTGIELLIYAIIYGFSQDGESCFKGSCQYLADWCGCSTRTVLRYLNDLMKKEMIKQVYHSPDNYEVHYAAVIPYDKLSQGLMTNCHKAYDKKDTSLTTNCHKAYDKKDTSLTTNCHKATDKMSQAIKDNIDNNIANKLVDIRVCDTPAKKTTFRKPTIEAVKTFAERHGTAVIDPERFYNYYEANGWKVGKNQMKDWRAAFRMWEAREKNGAAASESGSQKPGNIPYMQNEYTEEHLKQKEEDSIKALDDLLAEE